MKKEKKAKHSEAKAPAIGCKNEKFESAKKMIVEK